MQFLAKIHLPKIYCLHKFLNFFHVWVVYLMAFGFMTETVVKPEPFQLLSPYLTYSPTVQCIGCGRDLVVVNDTMTCL